MKYIAFYDSPEYSFEKRSVAPSAANVVEYMSEIFSGYTDVEIISPSRTLNTKGFCSKRTVPVSERVKVVQPPSFGTKTKGGRALCILFTQLWFLLYLLCKVKRNEQIIVYHSLSVIFPVTVLKKVKNVKIVMEIREVYSDVRVSAPGFDKESNREKKREFKFFRIADKYIFPTELLNTIINTSGKPNIIATGIYRPEIITVDKWNDGKIHVVYAGTLNKNKGGALITVHAAALLTADKYHVHILGFGTESSVAEIKALVAEITEEKGVDLTYDGLLYGNDFKQFLQRCHIGLATQDSSGSFNDTSFPSKILTYLSNGLDVLSSRIPAVEGSPVGKSIYYYDAQSPEAIAKEIMKINTDNTVNKTELLNELDKKLRTDIINLLEP